MRYEELAANYLAMLTLAAIWLWLDPRLKAGQDDEGIAARRANR